MGEPLDKILPLNSETCDTCAKEAGKVLSSGGVVAVPTDTVYGIVSLLGHWPKLMEIKRRPEEKALGLFLEKVEDIPKYTCLTISLDTLLKLLPGPVTVVLKRADSLPAEFNEGNPNVGIRIAPNKLIRRICQEVSGQPLVQSSANISGGPSPSRINDFNEIWPHLDLIIDGGATTVNEDPCSGSNLGSTVVDLSSAGRYRILREGRGLENVIGVLKKAGATPFQ